MRTRAPHAAVLSLLFTLTAVEVGASERTLDLALATGTRITLAGSPGEVVTFTLVNRLPTGDPYTITIEERPIPVPPFSAPNAPQGVRSTEDACSTLVEAARALEKATDETQVAKEVRGLRAGLATGTCKNSGSIAEVNEWLGRTIQVLPEPYVLRAGAELVLTVVRRDKIWTLIVSAGARGTWLTTYGLSVVPSRDQPYFTKRIETDGDAANFAITAESEVDDVRLIPSVYFTWLPRQRMLGSFTFGPTAGLGLSKERAALFAGVGATYNWNLGFIAGVGISPHTRLRGRYQPDEIVFEALEDDQVNRLVFRPTWTFAVTFRFAGNPFTPGTAGNSVEESEKAGEAAERNEAAAKKAAAERNEAAAEKAAAEKEAAAKK